MKRRIFYILLMVCIVQMAHAVVATPDPVWCRLPDGTWAEVYMYGDEHGHYLTTLTGDRIAGSEVGEWADGQPAAQRIAPIKKLDSYVPKQGTIRIPVVLVNYADLQFTMENAKANFDDFYNGDGGTHTSAVGSVNDYYLASSDSMLNLVFDIYGPYTLSKNMAYYGANTSNSHMQNMTELVNEAARLAVADGVDMAQYDNDGDGYIDNLSIIGAGYNEAEGGAENTIWPHYSYVSSSGKYSSKYLKGYLIISEYRGSGGKQQAGIGTYCHEFGHALGLPDLYDTKNGSRYTVGTWDVMCSGSYNNNGCTPPSYSAFERFALGWLTPTELQTAGDYAIEPLVESSTAYLIAASAHNLNPLSPSPAEYFMVENRQAVGWDAHAGALVGTGMMVSHITFNKYGWERNTFNNGKVLGYAIVGAYDPKPNKSTASDLFPGTRYVTSWMPTLNDGTQLPDKQFNNIRQMQDKSMRFSFGSPSNDGIFLSENVLPELISTFDKRVVHYDTAVVEVEIRNLPNDTLKIATTNTYFDFSIDGGDSWWREAYPLVPNDTLYRFTMLVRHTPRRQSCDVQRAYISVESMMSYKMQQLEVSGYSPRPVYITQPVLRSPLSVTSTSVVVSWEGQADAQWYYPTLFSMQDIPSQESETFDDFNSYEQIEHAGWWANFVRLTPVVSESQNAVLFNASGEQLISKEYLLPLDGVRLWLSNSYVANSAETVGGKLLLEGRTKAGQWREIDCVRVINTTKNLVKEYPLNTADSIIQIRMTYTHHGGDGGCVVDGFEARMPQTIDYVCRDADIKLYAPDTTAVFYNLQPNTEYYFTLQAYEEKSCSGNYSPQSNIQVIKTLGSGDEEQKLHIIPAEDGVFQVKLPNPGNGAEMLSVYTPQGMLLQQIAVPYMATQITISDLPGFGIYYLKVVDAERMRRKGAYGKLIYTNN